MNYFDKLPVISYSGYTVKNLLARAKIDDTTKNNKLLYYPYTLGENDRVDIVSNYYYNTPGYSWLIWLANEVVDPYYDLPISEADFNEFIVAKYGSLEASMRKIKYYRNNWADNLDQISLAEYDALSGRYKKYYNPIVDIDYNPIAYNRRRDDETVSTNRTVIMTVTSDASFTVGEEVRANSSTYGFVTFSNTSSVTCQNLTGQFTANTTITGQESAATANIVSINLETETIAHTDALYWTAVSYFDHEKEENESKKDINLIDVRYSRQVENDLKKLMNR